MKITVGLQKGGTGKSTTAVMVALLLWLLTGKKVLLVDADPRSQSTVDWRGLAGEEWPAGVTVIQRTSGLARGIRDALPGHEHLVVDTGGDNPEILRAALEETDLLIAPIAPNAAEFRRIPATVEVAQEVAKDGNPDLELLVLFVKVVGESDLDAKDIRSDLDGLGVPYVKTMVPDRRMYARAFGDYFAEPERYGAYLNVVKELLEGEKDARS